MVNCVAVFEVRTEFLNIRRQRIKSDQFSEKYVQAESCRNFIIWGGGGVIADVFTFKNTTWAWVRFLTIKKLVISEIKHAHV
jgi:polysaccharide pyruvyl transferase WcaK-like protein